MFGTHDVASLATRQLPSDERTSHLTENDAQRKYVCIYKIYRRISSLGSTSLSESAIDERPFKSYGQTVKKGLYPGKTVIIGKIRRRGEKPGTPVAAVSGYDERPH